MAVPGGSADLKLNLNVSREKQCGNICGKKPDYTAPDKAEARRLLREGFAWDQIAQRLDVHA